jgi:RNA polymerase sigma factor (sigma-70 family)
MNEALILNGLKACDKKAFDMLYDLLYEQVCFYAEQIVKNEIEAEDIAIHSLAKFWEKGAGDFESFIQVRTYIFLTARNAAFDFLRKIKTQRTIQRDLMYITTEAEDSVAELSDLAMYKVEMLQFLLEEIEKLPEQCRETFKLVFIENMPRPLVAEKLNITISTVHSHCANGKNRLRQIFSERELIILLLLARCGNTITNN